MKRKNYPIREFRPFFPVVTFVDPLGALSALWHLSTAIDRTKRETGRMAHRSTGKGPAEEAGEVVRLAEKIVKKHMAK
jgi:hypothetical protein